MTATLGDLLRRSADALPDHRVDVAALVAAADRRQRRRRVAAAVTAVAVVGAVVAGSFAVGTDRSRTLEPAPSPSPSPPGSVAVDPTGTRPLVYTEGSTVHVGDRAVEANARVMFVDVTDDGVVFMTDADDRLWFSDGSGAEVIGEVPVHHLSTYHVYTSNPGSLVAWQTGAENRPGLVVYDTAQHAVLARLQNTDYFVLGVGPSAVYTNPAWWRTPGCWVIDQRPCSDPHLFRYDVPSGRTDEISRDAYEAELLANPRNFVIRAEVNEATRSAVFPLGARLHRHGERLVVSGEHRLTRTSGDPVALRWTSPRGGIVGFWAVQWLDDDRVVLAGYEEDEGGPSGIGQGDSYAASYVDLLVCTLSTGGCDEVVPLDPGTPYLPPGRYPF